MVDHLVSANRKLRAPAYHRRNPPDPRISTGKGSFPSGSWIDDLTDEDDYLPNGVRRCTAYSTRNQRRCGGAAMLGSTVCQMHGGKSKQAQRKAQFRLATLVDPSIGRLARIMANGNDRDALRAIENILDRAGYPRKVETSSEDARTLLISRLRELHRQQDAADEADEEDGVADDAMTEAEEMREASARNRSDMAGDGPMPEDADLGMVAGTVLDRTDEPSSADSADTADLPEEDSR